MLRILTLGSAMTLVWTMVIPSTGSAQDCNWCSQCLNEERFETDESGDIEVLEITANCSKYDVYQCEELIECEPSDEDASEQEELVSILAQGNGVKLQEFISSRSDRLDLVFERDLILFRGGCGNDVLGVFEVPGLRTTLSVE